MANPLVNMMSGMPGPGGMNPMQIMQHFNQFRRQFPQNANPKAMIDQMVQSGKVTRDQVNAAAQMAKQMGLIK